MSQNNNNNNNNFKGNQNGNNRIYPQNGRPVNNNVVPPYQRPIHPNGAPINPNSNKFAPNINPQGRPPIPGKPMQGKPMQGKPMQGKPMQGNSIPQNVHNPWMRPTNNIPQNGSNNNKNHNPNSSRNILPQNGNNRSVQPPLSDAFTETPPYNRPVQTGSDVIRRGKTQSSENSSSIFTPRENLDNRNAYTRGAQAPNHINRGQATNHKMNTQRVNVTENINKPTEKIQSSSNKTNPYSNDNKQNSFANKSGSNINDINRPIRNYDANLNQKSDKQFTAPPINSSSSMQPTHTEKIIKEVNNSEIAGTATTNYKNTTEVKQTPSTTSTTNRRRRRRNVRATTPKQSENVVENSINANNIRETPTPSFDLKNNINKLQPSAGDTIFFNKIEHRNTNNPKAQFTEKKYSAPDTMQGSVPVNRPTSGTVPSRPSPPINSRASMPRRPQPPVSSNMRNSYKNNFEELPEEPKHSIVKTIVTSILIVLLVLVLLIVGIFVFLPNGNDGIVGSLNGIKTSITNIISPAKNAEAMDFTAFETNSEAPAELFFTLTTNKSAIDIRIMDENNSILDSNIKESNNEAAIIWSISTTFAKSYEGMVFAEMLQENGEWIRAEQTIAVKITEAPQPTLNPTTPTPEPQATLKPAAVVVDEDSQDNAIETTPEVLNNIPVATKEPAPVVTATLVPTATPSPKPTATPEPTAEPTPIPEPTLSPIPIKDASSTGDTAPEVLKVSSKIYTNSGLENQFARKIPISVPDPAYYSQWGGGIFAFRTDAYRQNASYGTSVEGIKDESLELAWSVPVGGLKLSNGYVYGFGYMSQPAIIKWYKEARDFMNIDDEKKQVEALKEVIFASQDGNIYFLDLADGQKTRDTIDMKTPAKSAVSIYPGVSPMLAVGQSASKLSNKTVDIGYKLYSLLDQERLMFIDGRDEHADFSNGAFDGNALFDRNSDSMIIAAENGMIYTAELNTEFDYLKPSLAIAPTIQSYKAIMGDEDTRRVGIEGSVAMYGNYAYTCDNDGFMQCVDVNTMTPVWVKDMGDNTDATIALDVNEAGEVSAYTGNTVLNNTKSNSIDLYRLNALNGEEIWKVEVAVEYNKNTIGLLASPIVGQNDIDNMVIFTVATSDSSAVIYALDKQTGKELWKNDISAYAVSSPVAVYNEDGSAWVVQCDSDGLIQMYNAQTGAKVSELQLEGEIEGSPAVYKNKLVVGTTGSKSESFIYCVLIK